MLTPMRTVPSGDHLIENTPGSSHDPTSLKFSHSRTMPSAAKDAIFSSIDTSKVSTGERMDLDDTWGRM